MSIDLKDYKRIETNIFRHKKNTNKFLFVFLFNKKKYRKIFTIKHLIDNKEIKSYILNQYSIFRLDIIQKQNLPIEFYKINTLEHLFQAYKNSLSNDIVNTKWFKSKENYYINHIRDYFIKLNIPIYKLKAKDIQNFYQIYLPKKLKSNRHIKTADEVLKPIFRFAYLNDIISDNLADKIFIKRVDKKRIVTKATEKFIFIYNSINELYKDNLFYRTFYLFGFSGRRISEVYKLKWENIDLVNNIYTITDTKNKETQQYYIPEFLLDNLKEMYLNKEDDIYVFQNRLTNTHIKKVDKQTIKLRNYLNMPSFSYQYFRHILVSYLAEQEQSPISLSAILGHRNSQSINKYLSLSYKNASKIANKVHTSILTKE